MQTLLDGSSKGLGPLAACSSLLPSCQPYPSPVWDWLQQSCDCCNLSDQLSLCGRLLQHWSLLLYIKALLAESYLLGIPSICNYLIGSERVKYVERHNREINPSEKNTQMLETLAKTLTQHCRKPLNEQPVFQPHDSLCVLTKNQ